MTQTNQNSKVPKFLSARIAALVVSAGLAGGTYWNSQVTPDAQADQYVQAVAADDSISPGVKVAMVLGSFYESGGRHIGTPYVDKLGKGQPLTVCNGITGPGVFAGKNYTPADCYALERWRYLKSEGEAKQLLLGWGTYDPFVQGTFIDFVHNKGAAALASSSMLRKANAGDLVGACLENPRWSKGTVRGVSTVLPGLVMRGESNDEICREWRLGVQK